MDLCRVDMRRQRKSGVMCLTPALLPLSRDSRGGGGVTEVAAEGG